MKRIRDRAKAAPSPKSRAQGYLDRGRELFGMSGLEGKDERRDLHHALVQAKRALLLDPGSYEATVLMSKILKSMETSDAVGQALELCDKAIVLDPSRPDAYNVKAGLLMYELSQPNEAERLARKALTIAKQTHEPVEFLELRYSDLIEILVERKKYSQARWMVKRALHDCPTDFMKAMVKQPLLEIESQSKAEKS